jgi:hypothetical protein
MEKDRIFSDTHSCYDPRMDIVPDLNNWIKKDFISKN